MKKLTLSLLTTSALLLSACSSSQVTASLPLITIASSVGAGAALGASKASPAVQAEVYDISLAIYSVTGGNIAPTVAQLKTALSQKVNGIIAFAICDVVTRLYAQYYPELSGNVKLADQLLNAIASGVNQAAALPTNPTASTCERIILAKIHTQTNLR